MPRTPGDIFYYPNPAKPVFIKRGRTSMKKQSSKSVKFMEYIMNHPTAKVGTVAKKFGITPSLGYQLRKKALDNQIGVFAPPEMVPMPEPRLPDWAFGDNVDKTLDTRARVTANLKMALL
jgi:hypothetical protein